MQELDIEEPGEDYFGAKLKAAVESGDVSQAELDSHVCCMLLRSEFTSGIIDYPIQKSVVDVEARPRKTARKLEEQSLVLLQNKNSILPLSASRIKSIAVVGKNADMGMISGGGSAQVDPMGTDAPKWQQVVWFPTSPLKAIANKAPGTKVSFASNENVAAAAALAKQSDIAIVFAYQWSSEGMDLKNLSLPRRSGRTDRSSGRGEPAHHCRAGDGHRRHHAVGEQRERHHGSGGMAAARRADANCNMCSSAT